MSLPSEDELRQLLCKTESLVEKMVVVKANFGLQPTKDHVATFVRFADLLPLNREFLNDLIAIITRYVFSNERCLELLTEYEKGRDPIAACNLLFIKARNKFKSTNLKGQFSELVLFALLQHHYDAVPLLRKMNITTNREVERHGADAIHVGYRNQEPVLYIGEAKTYDRESYALRAALKDSIDSIITHYNEHLGELDSYSTSGFLEPKLASLAQDYRDGKLQAMRVELVCICTYRTEKPVEQSAESIERQILNQLRESCSKIRPEVYSDVPEDLLPRMNYILFPVVGLEAVVRQFEGTLGNDNE